MDFKKRFINNSTKFYTVTNIYTFCLENWPLFKAHGFSKWTHYTRQCPHMRWQYKIKNKGAMASHCESNVKWIAALLYIPYSWLIWGDYTCYLPWSLFVTKSHHYFRPTKSLPPTQNTTFSQKAHKTQYFAKLYIYR